MGEITLKSFISDMDLDNIKIDGECLPDVVAKFVFSSFNEGKKLIPFLSSGILGLEKTPDFLMNK